MLYIAKIDICHLPSLAQHQPGGVKNNGQVTTNSKRPTEARQ